MHANSKRKICKQLMQGTIIVDILYLLKYAYPSNSQLHTTNHHITKLEHLTQFPHKLITHPKIQFIKIYILLMCASRSPLNGLSTYLGSRHHITGNNRACDFIPSNAWLCTPSLSMTSCSLYHQRGHGSTQEHYSLI